MSRHIIFLSHGGGPLPLLGDPSHQEMNAAFVELAQYLPQPRCILVISAHWETDTPYVTGSAQPELIYDYYGFPEESYQIKYPAPGEPTLAAQLVAHLRQAGQSAQLSPRGFDHGVFVPLKLLYPAADIPCLQLSLPHDMNPALSLELGKALNDFPVEDLLIVGSGLSFHNLRAFFAPLNAQTRAENEGFEDWLVETCCAPQLSHAEREQRLLNWEQAPGARFCHPREEHLLPLHVCYGAAQQAADEVLRYRIVDKYTSSYVWRL